MDAPSILICYDNSDGSRRAVDAAAELFAGYHAVVLNIAPLLTGPESVAELSALPANFDQVNEDEGLAVAREGATSLAWRASPPRRGPTSPLRPGKASSASRTRSMRP
jgi:hypothetical protein